MNIQPSQGLPSIAENVLANRPPVQPPKGSPLPFDLAQMLAKQKVLKAAVDAETQRMLQQSAGQGKPPTVDQSLNEKMAQLFKPPQQQAGPDLQAAAMGPGMNNQGAAPPNGGAVPQPQQPTVRAAQGGLMQVPSNLPRSYAGGGIIAFEGGGTTDRYRSSVDAAMNEEAARVGGRHSQEELDKKGGALKYLLALIAGGSGAAADEKARQNNPNYSNEGDGSVPTEAAGSRAAPADDPRRLDTDVTLGSTTAPTAQGMAALRAAAEKGDPDAVRAYKLFSAKYPNAANVPAQTGPYNADRAQATPPTQTAPPTAGLPAAAAANPLAAATDKAILSDLNTDQDAAFSKGKQRYQDNMGSAQQGLLAAYQQATAEQKAAIERGMKAREDNRWGNRMIGLGSVFSGAHGLTDPAAAKAFAAATAAGHEADVTDSASIQKLLTGNAEQQFKAAGDTYGAGVAGSKSAADAREKAITAGAGRANNADTNAMHERTTGMSNATQIEVAKINAAAREQAATVAATARTKDEFVANMKGLIQLETKQLDEFKGKDFLSPEAKARKARIEAKIDALKQAMTEHDPRLAPAGAAPTSRMDTTGFKVSTVPPK